MPGRTIDMFFDVNRDQLRDSVGALLQPGLFPSVTFREQAVINLRLVTDQDLTPFTQFDAGTETYSATMGTIFGAEPKMIKTTNVGINVADDWDGNSSGDADPAQGEFSVRLDADTVVFQARVDGKVRLDNSRFELQAKDTGGAIIGVFVMPFLAINLLSDDSAIPAENQNQFEFIDVEGTQCLIIKAIGSDGIEEITTLCPPGVEC